MHSYVAAAKGKLTLFPLRAPIGQRCVIPSFTPIFVVPHKGADDYTVITIQVATVMVAITINAAIA